MVLWTAKLERFQIPESTIRKLVDGGGHVYDTLNTARVKFYEREYASAIQNVQDISGRHEESQDILAKLCRGVASQDVHDFLLERNTCHCDLGEMECRTLILMDGTHSMHPVLELTKNCIRKMFERTTECIRSQGSLAGGVGMQLCVYRNYNATEDLMLQCSNWESSPDDLLLFLEGAAGGAERLVHRLDLRRRRAVLAGALGEPVALGDLFVEGLLVFLGRLDAPRHLGRRMAL